MLNSSSFSFARVARTISLVSALSLVLVGCNSVVGPQSSLSGDPGKHQDDGGGGNNANAVTSLFLGKIAPLTTAEHHISGEITVPMGYPVSLRAEAATAENFEWRGLPLSTKGMSDEGYRGKSAEINFATAGNYTIRVIPMVHGQQRASDAQILVVHVQPVTFKFVNFKLYALNGPADGGGDGVKQGRGGRIQGRFPEGAAQVAMNASVELRALSFPGGFENMVEWRVDGQVQKELSKSLSLSFATAGTHRIEGADGAIEVTVTDDDQVIHH